MRGTQGEAVAIAGMSSGIGEATALLLAARGRKSCSTPGGRIDWKLWRRASRLRRRGGHCRDRCDPARRY